MNVELHVHTRFSKDSMLNFYFILLMCKIRKIDCIAITDHNEIKGAIKYKKKLEKYNIYVIIGEEIFTKNGEIIGLFLKEKIMPDLTPEETIRKIKLQDGLVYIPHPYDNKRKKSVLEEKYIKEFSKEIDMIEIHNGRNIEENYDFEQARISKENNILPVIGSDAHIFWELGRNYITLDSIDRKDIINSIKKSKFYTKKCIKMSHVVTKIVKVLKMMFRGEINELFGIIIKKCRGKKHRVS